MSKRMPFYFKQVWSNELMQDKFSIQIDFNGPFPQVGAGQILVHTFWWRSWNVSKQDEKFKRAMKWNNRQEVKLKRQKEEFCQSDTADVAVKLWHFFHLSLGESSCFHSTVSRDDWWKWSEVHFAIQNERAFWEMAGTPIYTFQESIGELSQPWSEWSSIEPDKRTQSVWKSWHVPRWC